jgi:hypothetical protein
MLSPESDTLMDVLDVVAVDVLSVVDYHLPVVNLLTPVCHYQQPYRWVVRPFVVVHKFASSMIENVIRDD